jgi:hypothetical protein
LVPYAVELAVSVLDNIDSHEDQVNRVVIRDGRLTTYRMQVQQVTYTVNNKADAEQTLYLDHARQAKEWELFDTPNPLEITENFWRFRFALPAKKVTKFVVRQRYPSHYIHSLSDLNDNRLGYWLEQRYFDKKTEQVLRAVVEERRKSAEHEQNIVRLQAEREKIHADQKRIRDNLQSLGDRASEKDLRERFVRTLNGQEDRLEKIEVEIKEQTAARDRCAAKINELLAKLEYEGSV